MHAPYCLNENRVFHEARAIIGVETRVAHGGEMRAEDLLAAQMAARAGNGRMPASPAWPSPPRLAWRIPA